MTTIAYIYHSGFAVITDKSNLVFDFWKEGDASSRELPEFLQLLDRDNPTIVFVSHFHKDHFNPEVFKWDAMIPRMNYVISKDVEKHARRYLRKDTVYDGPKPDPEHVHVMREGETLEIGDVRIKAFGSTDTGVSYMVETDDETFFHAGDLNWWSWGDDTLEETRQAREGFMKVIDPIRKEYGPSAGKKIDYLMFPVDPRLGGEYWKGAKLMTELFNVETLLPMHFTLGETPEQQHDFITSLRSVIATFQPFLSKRTILLTAPGSLIQSL